MASEKLRAATCQFPVSADVRSNARYVRRQMEAAASEGAHIVHFSEAALSGYGGMDVPTFEGFDWDLLRAETARILELARDLGVWVILGSAHFLSRAQKPTNCLYLIDSSGAVVDRYDKCMCTGGDLKVYTGGDHPVVFALRGVTCGLLICYDSCYPEMYNRYRHAGVEVVFHSVLQRRLWRTEHPGRVHPRAGADPRGGQHDVGAGQQQLPTALVLADHDRAARRLGGPAPEAARARHPLP